ncbi:MAG: hypothetical protein KAQ99_05720 [Candidatus Aureabacteria bacterium]|nr:hypothetical protein [Candidatus Auribacterota bacterium]
MTIKANALPPEKHTRILGKGSKGDEPNPVSWGKWYFGFAIGFLWGIMVMLVLQEVL